MSDDPIKDVLRRMPYGFYGITSKHGDDVNAMAANWVTQASFDPRLISLCLQITSYSYQLIEKGRVFAVNLFLKEDVDFLKPFTKSRAKRPEKMSEASFTFGPLTGCPILDECAAYFECKVVKIVETGGDHNIILGEVLAADIIKEGDVDQSLTLLDLGWSYAG